MPKKAFNVDLPPVPDFASVAEDAFKMELDDYLRKQNISLEEMFIRMNSSFSLANEDGNVYLFEFDLVGATATSKVLRIFRHAAAGDNYMQMHIDQYGQGVLTGDDPNCVFGFTTHFFDGNVVVGAGGGTDSEYLRVDGYLTAITAKRYAQFQVNDTDDYFTLTRESANILGFKVTMPLYANSTANILIIPTVDPAVAGAIWNDAGTLKVSAG